MVAATVAAGTAAVARGRRRWLARRRRRRRVARRRRRLARRRRRLARRRGGWHGGYYGGWRGGWGGWGAATFGVGAVDDTGRCRWYPYGVGSCWRWYYGTWNWVCYLSLKPPRALARERQGLS